MTRAWPWLLALLTFISSSRALAAGAWEEIARERGIVVSEREVPGRGLPIFRGVGEVRASVFEILAVLNDTNSNTEWMHRCGAAKHLGNTGPFTSLIYNRTTSPWPVSDRDVVLRTQLYLVEPGRQLRIELSSVKGKGPPVRDGVVRMPRLKGHYILTRTGPGSTRVEYQIDADPGGLLPDWVVRLASRDLPLVTLQNLRRQVRRSRGRYAAFLKERDPSLRDPALPPPPMPPMWGRKAGKSGATGAPGR